MAQQQQHDYPALCRRWFKEVWNENREQLISELMTPQTVIHGLGDDGQPGVGPEAFKKFLHHFRANLSNIHVVVHDVLSDGEQTAVRLTLTAKHTGAGFGPPPTDKTVSLTAIVWCHWRDGKMVEIDFEGGKPVRTGDQFGLGRVTTTATN